MADPKSEKPIAEKRNLGINDALHKEMQRVFNDYAHLRDNQAFYSAFTKATEAIRKATGKNIQIAKPNIPLDSRENATLFLNEITSFVKEAVDKLEKGQAAVYSPDKLDKASLPPIKKRGPPVPPRDPNLKLSTASQGMPVLRSSEQISQGGPSVAKKAAPPVPPRPSSVVQSKAPPVPARSSAPVTPVQPKAPPPIPARSSAPVMPVQSKTPPPRPLRPSTVIAKDVNQQSAAKPHRPLPITPQRNAVASQAGMGVKQTKAPEIKAPEVSTDPKKRLR